MGKFIAALEHPAPGQEDFEVKKPFIQGHQVEHIWLSDVRFVGNLFQGRIDNQPRKIAGLKIGEMASVKPNEISDWLFIDKWESSERESPQWESWQWESSPRESIRPEPHVTILPERRGIYPAIDTRGQGKKEQRLRFSLSGPGLSDCLRGLCTRQGSNLQPYDPKSYTLSN